MENDPFVKNLKIALSTQILTNWKCEVSVAEGGLWIDPDVMPVGSNSFYPAAICQSDTDGGLVVVLNGEKKTAGMELLTFRCQKGQEFLSQAPASGGREDGIANVTALFQQCLSHEVAYFPHAYGSPVLIEPEDGFRDLSVNDPDLF